MNSTCHPFVEAAEAGHPVYMSAVRAAFARLDPHTAIDVTCTFLSIDGAPQAFDLRLPRLERLPEADHRFVTEYFLATVYNILSTIGGSALHVSAPGDAPELFHLTRAVTKSFGVECSRADRPGYGRAINVAERMNEAVHGNGDAGRFRCKVVHHPPARSARPGASRKP